MSPPATVVCAGYRPVRCGAENPVLGRNHFWERLLIDRFANQAGLTDESAAALATTALTRLYDAQYVKVQTLTRNNGRAGAVNVNVRVPTGFVPASEDQSVSAFTLSPDDVDVERFYRTVSGIRESEFAEGTDGVTPPVTRFAVNWELDPNSQAGVVVWVGIALFVLWVAILFNDSRIRARDKKTDITASSSA